ncbi:hypothetical protein HDU96_000148 [Phlyctochytrium bullatum]|nr:hypothetical protein HDU96_000148 [Phlyctochytrium bullatum]
MMAAPPNTSTDARDFFQSDQDIRNHERLEKKRKLYADAGSPITVASKVLAFLIPVAADDLMLMLDGAKQGESEKAPLVAYVGESGHVARRLDLATGKTLGLYRGHTGPVTCITVSNEPVGPDGEQVEMLYTGSWDKTLRKWNAKTRDCLLTFTGHTDFIKSVLFLPSHNLLLTGSSDSTLRSWDATTAAPLSTSKGIHRRALESLALDPATGTVYSASSDTSIRKWSVTVEKSSAEGGERKVKVEGGDTFANHLTSVYGIVPAEEDLWSVSADKTAKRWNMVTGKNDMTLEHPDFVKCVAVAGPYIVTGGRDENIRVWDAASGKCLNEIEGHFGEISALQVARGKLWTGSLDSTIRQWELKTLATFRYVPPAEVAPEKPSLMTEDEERELEELMMD